MFLVFANLGNVVDTGALFSNVGLSVSTVTQCINVTLLNKVPLSAISLKSYTSGPGTIAKLFWLHTSHFTYQTL